MSGVGLGRPQTSRSRLVSCGPPQPLEPGLHCFLDDCVQRNSTKSSFSLPILVSSCVLLLRYLVDGRRSHASLLRYAASATIDRIPGDGRGPCSHPRLSNMRGWRTAWTGLAVSLLGCPQLVRAAYKLDPDSPGKITVASPRTPGEHALTRLLSIYQVGRGRIGRGYADLLRRPPARRNARSHPPAVLLFVHRPSPAARGALQLTNFPRVGGRRLDGCPY